MMRYAKQLKSGLIRPTTRTLNECRQKHEISESTTHTRKPHLWQLPNHSGKSLGGFDQLPNIYFQQYVKSCKLWNFKSIILHDILGEETSAMVTHLDFVFVLACFNYNILFRTFIYPFGTTPLLGRSFTTIMTW
mgnify:CR=1 FL=1